MTYQAILRRNVRMTKIFITMEKTSAAAEARVKMTGSPAPRSNDATAMTPHRNTSSARMM